MRTVVNAVRDTSNMLHHNTIIKLIYGIRSVSILLIHSLSK